MKKIIIFLPLINTEGISKIISDYIKEMDSNVDIDILSFNIEKDTYFKDIDNKIYTLGETKNIYRRIKKEYQILKKGGYDVIHINGNYFSRIIECMVAKLTGIKKIIVHSHNNGSGNNNVKRVMLHNILKKLFDYFATDYFACSEAAAKWMFSKKIIKKQKYKIIKNGIMINDFKFNELKRKKIREELNIKEKYAIGFVGRLEYQKNPSFLVDIFDETKKQKENAVLLIIGTGSLEKTIKNRIKELKLDKSVIFLGNIANVNDYYNAMDCFLLPSKYEGLGIVNIEAQCSGLNTICSNNVAKEAKASENISFISLNDKEMWVNKILENKTIDRNNAYKEVIDYGYDIQSVVKEIEDIYLS